MTPFEILTVSCAHLYCIPHDEAVSSVLDDQAPYTSIHSGGSNHQTKYRCDPSGLLSMHTPARQQSIANKNSNIDHSFTLHAESAMAAFGSAAVRPRAAAPGLV
eukprot:3807494-Pleurochrysis_carterae.AAC.2